MTNTEVVPRPDRVGQGTAVVMELRTWRNRCFAIQDMFPGYIFPRDNADPANAAVLMGQHIAYILGMQLATRIEELEKEIGINE